MAKQKTAKLVKNVKKNDRGDDYWTQVTISLIAILFGALLLIAPELSFAVMTVISGLMAMLKGVSGLYLYFQGKKPLFGARLILTLDILLVLVGLVCVVRPEFVSSVIAYILAVWMMVEGVSNLSRLSKQKNRRQSRKLFDIIINATVIIMSLILIVLPHLAGPMVLFLLGILVFIFGINGLVNVALGD